VWAVFGCACRSNRQTAKIYRDEQTRPICPRSATGRRPDAGDDRGQSNAGGRGPGRARSEFLTPAICEFIIPSPTPTTGTQCARPGGGRRLVSSTWVELRRSPKISEDLLRSPCDRGEARAIDLCEYVLRPGHVADARAEGRAVRTELDLCLARTSDEHPRGFSVEIQRAQVVREGTAAAAAGGAVGVLRIVERSRERSCWPLLVPDEGGNQRSSVPITRQSRGHSSYVMKEAISAHQYQSRGNLEVTPRT